MQVATMVSCNRGPECYDDVFLWSADLITNFFIQC